MIVLNKTTGNVEPTDHRGQASRQQQHRHLSSNSFLVGSNAEDESSGSSEDHNDLAVVVCNELDSSTAVAMATSIPVSIMGTATETASLAANGCTMMVVCESRLPRASNVGSGSNGDSTHHSVNGRREKTVARPKQTNGSGARKLSSTAAAIAAAGNTVSNEIPTSALEERKVNEVQMPSAESVGCQPENPQRRQRQRRQQRQQQAQQPRNADEKQIEEVLNIEGLTDSVAVENHHRCLAIDSPTATTARSLGDDSPDSRSNSSATYSKGGSPPSSGMAISAQSMSSTSSGGSSSSQAIDSELGNKCGKCQNHEIEISKKGHARDCPFKKCNCLKCRLLDARSDILQVISGKETKLKGTKKDPNCGFCQNHGVKILRKGHVRSCGFGQERHFKQDNCFDCEVHYIRNEVNRLQIKMRRAMKEDRTLSEEQRKTAREAITRDEVEKVCDMARLARKKRENILMQQAGETSSQSMQTTIQHSSASPSSSSIRNGGSGGGSVGRGGSANVAGVLLATPKIEPNSPVDVANVSSQHTHHLNQPARQPSDVWRPWSQQQVAAAMAAQQQHHHQNQQHHHHQQHQQQQQQQQHHHHQKQLQLQLQLQQHQGHNRRQHIQHQANNNGQAAAILQHHQQQQQMITAGCGNDGSNGVSGAANNQQQQQQQLTNTITSMAMAANHTYLLNSLQAAQQQQQRRIMLSQQLQYENSTNASNGNNNNNLSNHNNHNGNNNANLSQQQLSPSSTPPDLANINSNNHNNNNNDQPLPLTQRNMQEQQLFNTLFRLIVAQFAQPAARQAPH